MDLSVCRDRTWRWFRTRLHGLLADDTTRVWARFIAPAVHNHDNDEQPDGGDDGE